MGDTIFLDGSGSADPDGDGITYAWSFVSRPSGSAAVLLNPTAATPQFTIDRKGNYVVQLVVSDGTLSSTPDTVTIVAPNRPPLANAGPDRTAHVGETVQLDGRGSSDPDGDPLTFAWTLLSKPTGSVTVLSGAGSAQPTLTPDKIGAYTVQLVVNDGAVNSAPDTMTISVANRPPVANAGPDQSGRTGDVIALDGRGSSDPDGDTITYAWSFSARPAGSAAALGNPASPTPRFTLDRKGEYRITLVVNDGIVNSPPDTVTVQCLNSPPIAHAGPDRSAQVEDTVTLDGSASYDPDGDPITYAWSITARPAGSAAELAGANTVSPSLVIDAPGNYTVQLVVNDGAENSAPDAMRVRTANSPPVADAGPDQSVTVGDTVTLDGGNSSDPDGDALGFAWSFASKPAESAATLQNANQATAFFIPDAPGTYIVQLLVNDGLANSDPDTATITAAPVMENRPPVAHAGANQSARVGQWVTLDGSASYDPDGDEITFRWSFVSKPGESAAILANSASVNPSFEIDAPGTYVIELIVNDGSLDSEPAHVTVSTINSAPVADAGPNQSGRVGQEITLDGSRSYDVDGDALRYAWRFTQRPDGSAATLSNPAAVRPRFTIDQAGTYVIELIVNDGSLDSEPAHVTVSTENSPPVANAGPDQTRQVGQQVTLDGRNSYDPDGDPITYAWRFVSRPEGSAAALSGANTATPTFVIDVFGEYVVQLIVSDGILSSAPDTVVISTTNSRPVANAGPDQSVTVGDVVRLDGSASHDPDGDALTYHWSIASMPTGSAAHLNDSAAVQPTFVADKAGQFVVQLIVSDGVLNSAADSVVIEASDPPDPCPNPPLAPANVSATDGVYATHVVITWTGSPGATAYRVWRADAPDSDAAQPINGWIPNTFFDDDGARAAEVIPPTGCFAGCNNDPEIILHYHYYWVEARINAECMSELVGPDRGHRAASTVKSFLLDIPQRIWLLSIEDAPPDEATVYYHDDGPQAMGYPAASRKRVIAPGDGVAANPDPAPVTASMPGVSGVFYGDALAVSLMLGCLFLAGRRRRGTG